MDSKLVSGIALALLGLVAVAFIGCAEDAIVDTSATAKEEREQDVSIPGLVLLGREHTDTSMAWTWEFRANHDRWEGPWALVNTVGRPGVNVAMTDLPEEHLEQHGKTATSGGGVAVYAGETIRTELSLGETKGRPTLRLSHRVTGGGGQSRYGIEWILDPAVPLAELVQEFEEIAHVVVGDEMNKLLRMGDATLCVEWRPPSGR
jgi:hypothetical protein